MNRNSHYLLEELHGLPCRPSMHLVPLKERRINRPYPLLVRDFEGPHMDLAEAFSLEMKADTFHRICWKSLKYSKGPVLGHFLFNVYFLHHK